MSRLFLHPIGPISPTRVTVSGRSDGWVEGGWRLRSLDGRELLPRYIHDPKDLPLPLGSPSSISGRGVVPTKTLPVHSPSPTTLLSRGQMALPGIITLTTKTRRRDDRVNRLYEGPLVRPDRRGGRGREDPCRSPPPRHGGEGGLRKEREDAPLRTDPSVLNLVSPPL